MPKYKVGDRVTGAGAPHHPDSIMRVTEIDTYAMNCLCEWDTPHGTDRMWFAEHELNPAPPKALPMTTPATTPTTDAPLAPGDIVRLNSGSPPMTVEGTDHDSDGEPHARVTWYDATRRELQGATLPTATLTRCTADAAAP